MPRGIPRTPEAREYVLTKKCGTCGEIKPWADFSPMSYWEDGSVRRVYSYCKRCDSQRQPERKRRYRQDNKERLDAYNSDWKARRRKERAKESSGNDHRLPAHPLKVLLWENLMEMETPSWTDLAAQCDVPERSIRRVLTQQENVSLRFADQVCTRLGASIYDLWPHLQEEAA